MVKFSTVLGSLGAYKYKDRPTFEVTMPATQVCLETKEVILRKCKQIARVRRNAEEQLESSLSTSIKYSSIVQRELFFEQYRQEAHQQADNWNIEIGYAYATSGQDKSQEFYEGSLDWAIFCCSSDKDIKNKVI